MFLIALTVPADLDFFDAAELLRIIDGASHRERVATLADLSSYLDIIFPKLPHRTPRTTGDLVVRKLYFKKRKRRKYARQQRNWYKHQGRCIKSILDGESDVVMPPQPIVEGFWRTVFEQRSVATPPVYPEWAQDLGSIWHPISIDEIAKSEPGLNTPLRVLMALLPDCGILSPRTFVSESLIWSCGARTPWSLRGNPLLFSSQRNVCAGTRQISDL